MSNLRDEAERERIERVLRLWGRRPPSTEAAIAARRIVARIPERSRRSSWRWPLLAAAGAALFATSVWLGVHTTEIPHYSRPTLDEAPPPLPSNVVLWWLDPQTPVYFVTRPLEARLGELP